MIYIIKSTMQFFWKLLNKCYKDSDNKIKLGDEAIMNNKDLKSSLHEHTLKFGHFEKSIIYKDILIKQKNDTVQELNEKVGEVENGDTNSMSTQILMVCSTNTSLQKELNSLKI